MKFIFLNNWRFNTSEFDEDDEDFIFDLFSIKYSWRYRWVNLTIFNFEIRILWKGKTHVKGM